MSHRQVEAIWIQVKQGGMALVAHLLALLFRELAKAAEAQGQVLPEPFVVRVGDDQHRTRLGWDEVGELLIATMLGGIDEGVGRGHLKRLSRGTA